jgi:transposase
MARYIGIDLHRNRFTVCTITESGRKYLKTVGIASMKGFAKTLRNDDEVAVEMTTNTRLFKGVVEPHVRRVVVVDAAKFKVVSESTKKTDRHDAENLAFFLSKDMLPELRMKDAAHERLHSLCQTKDKMTKQRTQFKNKINNVLAAVGILLRREELSSDKALAEVLKFELDRVTMIEIEILVDQIRSLNRAISRLKKEITLEGEK